MEDVYLEFQLDTTYDHIDNRGWMNLFQHWTWSGMLAATWAITAATYDPRFQRFCHNRLDLRTGRLRVPRGGGEHREDLPARRRRGQRPLCSALQTRSGVAGRSRCVTPRSASASRIALIPAGSDPATPDSPAPFTPSGLVVQGAT